VILETCYLGCLSHASYLVGDERAGVAAVIDPRRDVDAYLELARRHGVEIQHVVLTHFHADFVAGHLELARRTGATIHLGPGAEAEYDFVPLAEGDALELGRVRLVAIETPGHTPEGISLLVHDGPGGPCAVFTGDTLFLGDVGRPDLMASQGVAAEELAGMLHASLQKLARLPDATLVYPAHGAGSACGKNLSNERVGTIGQQKAVNWALQPMPRQQFVRQATADLPCAPAYFPHAAELNRRVRPMLDEALERALAPLALDDLLAAQRGGAVVLDTREPDEFARGHLAGALNVGLSGRYAQWCGTLIDRTTPIVLVVAAGRERESALRLGRIGFDQVRGWLAGGFEAAARARPELVRSFARLDAPALARELAGEDAPLVVDVRQPGERAMKHIGGSLFVPLDELAARTGELPRDRRLVLHCAGGFRSSIAASLLLRRGFTELGDLAGGLAAWEAARQPVAEG
jgi:glyoxylase-like metal-dependent hydrolase (beta-lactamase superfamily II)